MNIIDIILILFQILGVLFSCLVILILFELFGGKYYIYFKNFFLTPYYCVVILLSYKKAKEFHEAFKIKKINKSNWGLRLIKYVTYKKIKNE